MARGFQATKTHCKRGHLYTPETLRISGHKRRCRQCDKEREALKKAERRNQLANLE
jgi:hypothetical protein